MVIERKAIGPDKGLTAEIVVSIIEEEGTIAIIEVTDPIIELGVGQGMAMEIEEMTDLIMDKVTEETILVKSMVSKGTEIEV